MYLKMDRESTNKLLTYINVLKTMGVISHKMAMDTYANIYTLHHRYLQDVLAGQSDRPLGKD